jgi:hypothetical protein
VTYDREKNSGIDKYGRTLKKFTQAYVPQNMDRVDGKHERGEGLFAHKTNNEFYD